MSKFLSLVLRHQPEKIGLVLDEYGWASTGELIEKINSNGFSITLELLTYIVDTNNKKRFSFSENGSRIRANQGHSLEIDLKLEPAIPPKLLYHGTGIRSVESILVSGLIKMSRQHVHLSGDKEAAIIVGQRHGKPAVFRIDSGQMQTEGYVFYLSENKIWLTEHVPPEYLQLI